MGDSALVKTGGQNEHQQAATEQGSRQPPCHRIQAAAHSTSLMSAAADVGWDGEQARDAVLELVDDS